MFIIKTKILVTSGSASALTLIATAFPLQTTFANSFTVVENHYPISFNDAVDRQMGLSAPPQTDRNGRWQNASRNDVAYYMNPNNFNQGTSAYLQFLDLSSSAGLSAQSINSQLLSNKGTLSGHGQTFINASKLHGVNEIYLISHALLETGNGGSQLARGVQYNGRTVYNMYGIGAFDGNAVQAGARYAYNQGWFTPEDAIIGGARFVSNNYFARGQTTLYKMRWNPASPGTYQYATDVGWAVKQTHQMANLYGLVDNYNLQFSVPVYNNQPVGNQPGDNELEPLPPNTYGTTTARLNVRTGPGTSHSVLTTLNKDERVELIAKTGQWYQIKVGNVEGYVSGQFLTFSQESEDQIEEVDEEIIAEGKTTARLNLRAQPNTNSSIRTTLSKDQTVQIVKKEGNWYFVRVGFQTGWVSADFVSITSDNVEENKPSLGSATTTARLNLRSGAGTSHRVLTTLPVGQKLELLQKQGNWYQVKAGNQTGWVSADFIKTDGNNVGDNKPSLGSATTTARLNLRSGAGTSHRVLTTLPVGQKLELLQKQGNWYQVKAGNQTGWVSADFIKTDGNNVGENKPSLGSATTTARLNLRSGAGTSHRVLTTLPVGQKLELLQKQGNWYQVKAGNQTGWVSADFIKTDGNNVGDNKPSLGSATTTARLNLRSGAGTSHRVLTTLPVGQKLELLQKQGNWYQVKAGNQTGWVSADFIKTDGNNVGDNKPSLGSATTTARLNLRSGAGTSHRVLTTLPVGQKLELLQKQGNWYQVKAGSQTGWVSADFIKTNGNNVGENKPSLGSATTTARLNLRSGAGTSHRVLTTLPVGQKLELLQKQGNWYQVKAGNQTGWVSADFLSTNSEAKKEETIVTKAGETTARLNLREGAGTSYKVLTTLNKGQSVEILSTKSGWHQIKVGSQTGWVSAQYVQEKSSEPSIQAMSRSLMGPMFVDEPETVIEEPLQAEETDGESGQDNSSKQEKPEKELDSNKQSAETVPNKEKDLSNQETDSKKEPASAVDDVDNDLVSDSEDDSSSEIGDNDSGSDRNDDSSSEAVDSDSVPESDDSSSEVVDNDLVSDSEDDPSSDDGDSDSVPESDDSSSEGVDNDSGSDSDDDPSSEVVDNDLVSESDDSSSEVVDNDLVSESDDSSSDDGDSDSVPESDDSSSEIGDNDLVSESDDSSSEVVDNDLVSESDDSSSDDGDSDSVPESDDSSSEIGDNDLVSESDDSSSEVVDNDLVSESDDSSSEGVDNDSGSDSDDDFITLTIDTDLLVSADNDSDILLQLVKGQSVEVLETHSGYVKIKVNGKEGWIKNTGIIL
ncbi:SH3 domain-containing protein [Shouchella hunanensis]|uniref:SH3 domain-containing protein n=1 Tax=Shouchella hunanensis TaxID=766894 RepID=A0ABY7W9E5_9BACI|nr:SH3 domain-containing protein [Shouchella hunanensis]WDF04465.1 SH3 domain-containing protein [Shouchella hunanensis]